MSANPPVFDKCLLRHAEPAEVRSAARQGQLASATHGLARGYVQANLAILPERYAFDFLRFCLRNPKPCPIVEVTDPGDPEPRFAAPGADIRTDLPGYRIYREGKLVDEVPAIEAHWRQDSVAFLLGCSNSFDEILLRNGNAQRHTEGTDGRMPVYRTNIECVPAGIFHGPVAVTMRPIPSADVVRVVELSSRFPIAHGSAAEIKLPRDVSWTAFGTTSSGYAQSVGIGQMLKSKYGVDLRIIPGENDVARMVPLKAGQSKICACGIASYFAQEGVQMFASKQWGPQRLFNLFNNVGINGQTAAVAADVGVKAIADLKGKRVAWIKASPGNNTNMTAFLAFGGLSWADVERVEVPGVQQSLDAVVNGQVDAAWASTLSGTLNQIAASLRGLYYPPMPKDDEAGWGRAQAIAPWFAPVVVESFIKAEGVEKPFEGMNYPYPLFVAVPGISDELAYGLTAAVLGNFDAIKDAGPSMEGYAIKPQLLSYIFPYHPQAIAYFKEQGHWTDAAEADNAELLKRQDVLAAAWKKISAMDVPDADFESEWLKLRATSLKEAGLPVIFEADAGN